jgi:hypothetical protein
MKKTMAALAIAATGVLGGGGAVYAATTTHESGSYCKKADHGKSGTNAKGKPMVCKSYTAWHWVRK